MTEVTNVRSQILVKLIKRHYFLLDFPRIALYN